MMEMWMHYACQTAILFKTFTTSSCDELTLPLIILIALSIFFEYIISLKTQQIQKINSETG